MIQIRSNQSGRLKRQILQLLPKLNKKNTYQIIIIVFMSITYVISTFAAMIGSFVFMNPIFQCNNQNVPQQEACLQNQCKIVNNFTASYEAGLYCQKKYIRSTIQSAQFIGCIVSLFTLIPISDTKGRRFSLLIAIFLFVSGISLILIGIQTKIWFFMLIGQFLNGTFFANVNALAYIITGEFTSDKMRQRSIMIYCAMWGLGQMLFLPIYYFIPEWDNFLILFLLIPSVGLFIICGFFLLQTPIFCLFNAKDIKGFNYCIDMISCYNKSKQEDVQAIKKLAIKYVDQETKFQIKSLTFNQSLKLLSKRQTLIACLCIALSQSAFNVYYYAMQGSMERTGYNFGINMFLAGLHQFLGYSIIGIFIHRLQRKKSLIITIIISSLIGLSFLLPFIKNSEILQTVIVSIARLCTVSGYSFIALFQTESFQQKVRSTAFGASQGLSQISKVIVPYFIVKMNDIGIHPLIFSSAYYLVVGIVPVLFLKQTLKQNEQKNNQTQSNKQQYGIQNTTIQQNLLAETHLNEQNRLSIN